MTNSLNQSMALKEIVDSRANMGAILSAEGSLWAGSKAFGFSTAAPFSPLAILIPHHAHPLDAVCLRPRPPAPPGLPVAAGAARACFRPLPSVAWFPPPALLDLPVGLAAPFGASDNSAVIGSGLSGHTPCS
jgi:hypothetical protein